MIHAVMHRSTITLKVERRIAKFAKLFDNLFTVNPNIDPARSPQACAMKQSGIVTAVSKYIRWGSSGWPVM